MSKLFIRVRQQAISPSPSTLQSRIEQKLEPWWFSPTLKKKPVLTATLQRSLNAVQESSSSRPSTQVSVAQDGADLDHYQRIQHAMQPHPKPAESPLQPPGLDGSSLQSPQPLTLTASQHRPEPQLPTEATTPSSSERTRSSPWAPRNPLSTSEGSKPVGVAISLRTGKAVWSRRRPIWATSSLQLSSTPATPAASLRRGRATWSPRQPALAIAPFESLASPAPPPLSLRTGRAKWSPPPAPLVLPPVDTSVTPATPLPRSLRTGRPQWSPRLPASVSTTLNFPANTAFPPVSLRTGRAQWSPQQVPASLLWANGSVWSHSKGSGSLKAPPGSQTSNSNADNKPLDRRFSSQSAFYEYFKAGIDFDWAGEAQKLNQEARLLELLHALESNFQEQERRSST